MKNAEMNPDSRKLAAVLGITVTSGVLTVSTITASAKKKFVVGSGGSSLYALIKPDHGNDRPNDQLKGPKQGTRHAT